MNHRIFHQSTFWPEFCSCLPLQAKYYKDGSFCLGYGGYAITIFEDDRGCIRMGTQMRVKDVVSVRNHRSSDRYQLTGSYKYKKYIVYVKEQRRPYDA